MPSLLGGSVKPTARRNTFHGGSSNATPFRNNLALFLSGGAKAALTPHRRRTIKMMQRAVSETVPMCFAALSVSPNPPGEEGWYLLLSLTVVGDRAHVSKAEEAVLAAVEAAAQGWSSEDRLDYSEHIYFEIEPIC